MDSPDGNPVLSARQLLAAMDPQGTLAFAWVQRAIDSEQIFDVLGQMKGAAMKVGQLASFYEFAAPGDYLATYKDALTMLQNSAPPMDPEASKQVIKEEFGKSVASATSKHAAKASASETNEEK